MFSRDSCVTRVCKSRASCDATKRLRPLADIYFSGRKENVRYVNVADVAERSGRKKGIILAHLSSLCFTAVQTREIRCVNAC